MQLYAVRQKADQQPVGFFWAPDLWQLAIMVDSVTSPDMCEYKIITEPTALVWSDDIDYWKMGVRQVPDDEDADGEWLERHMQRVLKGMDFDGSLKCDGTMSQFVDGSGDIKGWRNVIGE